MMIEPKDPSKMADRAAGEREPPTHEFAGSLF